MRHAALSLALLLAAAPAAAKEQVDDFGENPGGLLMFQHVPAAVAGDAYGLVVLLHGCTQSTYDFDDPSGWLTLADQQGFALVMVQQQQANNPQGCFNWFSPIDTTRGSGEVTSIVQMVEHARADLPVTDAPVFVVGFSAGAAMAATLLVQYPEVFEAGALFAGVPAGCATNVTEALTCMAAPPDRTVAEWADAARSVTTAEGPWPRALIWHGAADTTVSVDNGRALAKQLVGLHGLDYDAGSLLGTTTRTTLRWPASGDTVVFEELLNLGHAVPVDGRRTAEGCGRAAEYFEDSGCSTLETADFFGLLSASEGEVDAVPVQALPSAAECRCARLPAHKEAGGAGAALFALFALAARGRRTSA